MSDQPRPAWTVLAHLLRPQGRKGEILAELSTDFPDRFRDHPDVSLARPGFAGLAAEARAASVTNFWLPVGRNHGRIVLSLSGVETIEAAEALSGLDVLIPTAERVDLDPDAQYIDDLLGCVVFDLAGDPDHPVEIGPVESVDFSTDAEGRRLDDVAPLLTVVTRRGDEVLIPYAAAFLVSVDVAGRRISMKLPAGLLDINRPDGARTHNAL